MRDGMTRLGLLTLAAAGMLAGCGARAPTLPNEPVEKAASCGVIAAASERAAAGVKGDLSAEAQERIFHYPLLAGSTDASFDADRADAVFKRMPLLFDHVVKGKWETLRPACADAFPATRIASPKLPPKPLDSMLQCYTLVDFVRKGLGGEGSAYGEVVNDLGVYADKLDAKLAPLLARDGIKGEALQRARGEALAAAARLGSPPAVIRACRAKYG